jgi:hypothetical protein
LYAQNQGNKKVTNAQEDFTGGGAIAFATAVKLCANKFVLEKGDFWIRRMIFDTPEMKKSPCFRMPERVCVPTTPSR